MADGKIQIRFHVTDPLPQPGRSETLVFAFLHAELAKECHDEATRIGLRPTPLIDGCFGVPVKRGPVFDALIDWVSKKGVKKIDEAFEWAIVENDA